MELGYTPDYAETITASRIAARRIFSPWQRYWCWPYYIVVAIASIALGYATGNLLRPAVGSHMASIIIPCTVAILYFIGAVIGIRLGRHLTARWLRQNSPERPTLFSLEPDGLRWQRNQTFAQIGFSDIDGIIVKSNLVGFLSGPGISYIPYRAFENAEQMKTLVKAVFDRLSDEAKQRSLEDAEFRSVVAA
jgi:hypothetical protein